MTEPFSARESEIDLSAASINESYRDEKKPNYLSGRYSRPSTSPSPQVQTTQDDMIKELFNHDMDKLDVQNFRS